jgi:ABC-type antimicrobial peptide transport system permease subunit
MPVRQHPFYSNELQLVVRTDGDPARLEGLLRSRAQSLNPQVAVKVAALQTMVSDSIAVPRFRTMLISLFASLALLLAMVGVYGVMSYTVAARTPEYGLRAALGADPNRICRDVLRQTLRLTGPGLAIGVALALGLSRLLASFVVGVETADIATFAGALACVATSSLAAAAGPAIRASRVDPLSALRQE